MSDPSAELNDCEDQGFGLLSDGCTKCRIGFKDGKGVYAEIVPEDGFYKCVSCGGSYGPVPKVQP